MFDSMIVSLNKVFKKYDDQILENEIKIALENKEKISEFRKTEEYKKIATDAWALYPRLFAIAGGKTWYQILSNNNKEQVKEIITKNNENRILKRNAKIVKMLQKEEVTEILSEEYVHTRDGFNGIFKVNTNKGIKTVTVTTIVAGGYNIQAAHYRVLTKIF